MSLKEVFERKGAISWHVLIFTIILLAGFVVLLFLFFQISFTGEIDREVCHESVVFKGSIPDIGGGLVEAKEFVPLKCPTEKMCVTDNRFVDGECDGFGDNYGSARVKKFGGEGESTGVQKVQIRKFIADEMVECWKTMGEGKLQIFSAEFKFLDSLTNTCVVCSRIAFDEKVQENLPEVREFSRYMIETPLEKGSDETYWEFFTGDKFSLDDLEVEDAALFFSFDKLNTRKEKSIVFTETRKTTWGKIFGAGSGIALGAGVGFWAGSAVPVVGNVVGLVLGGVIGGVGGFVGGDFIEDISVDFGSDFVSGVVLMDTEKVKELKCDSIASIP